MTCPHRKLVTKINGAGKYFVRCLDCNIDGAPRDTVTDAFLHRREDIRDAAALKAAEAAKGARA